MPGHSRTLWSLTFAWTALSGFQSTGIPFFAQAAFSGFRLAGCIDFSFHPFILPEPFWFAGKPLFLPRYVNLAGLWFCAVFFSTMSTFRECRELSLLEVFCHAPDNGQCSCRAPWLEVFFPLEVTLLLRRPLFIRYSSCEFLRCQTNIHMQTVIFK